MVGLINPGPGAITVNVRRWTGVPPAGAWGGVIRTSPSIPAKGIWMWAPDEDAGQTEGGTLVASEGHYRFDVSGGNAMLYKGNSFTPLAPGANRDNLFLMAPDINTGLKIGTDLVGAAFTQLSTPKISVTNQGASNADFQILHFVPTTAGTQWPMTGLDPSGSWVVVSTQTGLVPGKAFFYNVAVDGYYRVVSTNGVYLSAGMGASLVSEAYCDGDYLYATDTRRAYGTVFQWGARLDYGGGLPLEVHVVAPYAGTSVRVDIFDTANTLIWTSTQVSGPNDVGLRFPVVGTAGTDYNAKITSTRLVYAYVMSSDVINFFAPGETFFSVPPTYSTP